VDNTFGTNLKRKQRHGVWSLGKKPLDLVVGRGDEKFYVDGRKNFFPHSTYGTGSEDLALVWHVSRTSFFQFILTVRLQVSHTQ